LRIDLCGADAGELVFELGRDKLYCVLYGARRLAFLLAPKKAGANSFEPALFCVAELVRKSIAAISQSA